MTLNNLNVTGNIVKSQQAFNVAEAGINYYLWHLNHNSTDYKDGGTTPSTPDPNLGYGPYTHTYIDGSAVNEGTYTLWINPAGGGSSVVTVRSIGTAAGTNIKRTVQAQVGSPSFASYAVASDSALWFGNTESASGPVHSNQGGAHGRTEQLDGQQCQCRLYAFKPAGRGRSEPPGRLVQPDGYFARELQYAFQKRLDVPGAAG